MYYVTKRLEIAGSHRLNLTYGSKCKNMHGHNWIVTVHCRSVELNKNGMVIDFAEIKRLVQDPLDHKYFNDLFMFNPTAENIARWICEQIEQCYMVEVQESEGNTAIYEEHDDE